jgi:hypothetical protein
MSLKKSGKVAQQQSQKTNYAEASLRAGQVRLSLAVDTKSKIRLKSHLTLWQIKGSFGMKERTNGLVRLDYLNNKQ